MKVYIKRGAPNDRERRMVTALEKVINEKIAADPNYSFTPARNVDDLRRLYTEHCTEAIPFEEVPKTATAKPESQPEPALEKSVDEKLADLNKGDLEDEDDYDVVKKKENPLIRSNPKVRDYVMDDGFSSEPTAKKQIQSNFDEPTNFDDSFKLPEESDGETEGLKSSGGKKDKKEKPKPINPAFDEMDSGKQRKRTKMFAKHIVEGVCVLAEKGFIWFANKDINEAKLVEYDISGDIDLDILLTLGEGQEATVRQWFQGMNVRAEQLAVVDQESKDELAYDLAEVLLEKGVAPTPMQSLIMTAAKVFLIDKGVQLFALKMETGSVLSQLKSMKAEERNTVDQDHEEIREQVVKKEPESEKEQDGTAAE